MTIRVDEDLVRAVAEDVFADVPTTAELELVSTVLSSSVLTDRISNDPRPACNCGWGGTHDPDNPRCQRNQTGPSLLDSLTRTPEDVAQGVLALAMEYERDRNVCLEWIADPTMHVDKEHPLRLSDTAAYLDRIASRLRGAVGMESVPPPH